MAEKFPRLSGEGPVNTKDEANLPETTVRQIQVVVGDGAIRSSLIDHVEQI